MNRLFIFEDETPIKFYVDKKLVDCERILAQYSGVVTRLYDRPNVHIGSRADAIVRPVDPTIIPTIRPEWVEACITAGRLLPFYSYADTNGLPLNILTRLGHDDRDIAELIKAKVACIGDQVFSMLHRQFPHRTSDDWRQLDQRCEIDPYSSQLRPGYHDYLNTRILDILLHTSHFTPPVPQALPETFQVSIQDDYAEGRSEDEYMRDTDFRIPLYYGNSGNNATREPSQISATPVPATPPRMDSQSVDIHISNNNDKEEGGVYEDGENSFNYVNRSDTLPPEITTASRQPGRGVEGSRTKKRIPFGEADFSNMAKFLAELGRKPNRPDWETFRDRNQNRSVKAWSSQYHDSWPKIVEAAISLGLEDVFRKIFPNDFPGAY